MIGLLTSRSLARLAAVSFVYLLTFASPVRAQVRGLYTPGMSATNSGELPEAGLTYVAAVQAYSFDELKGADGEPRPVNLTASVFYAQNLFVWVSDFKIFGGTYAASANLPISNASLTLVRFGALQAGSGLSDSDFSPLTLGWQWPRADVQASYGFVAPTGRFHAGASDNTGGGYWAHIPSTGQTVYLTADKATAVSAYELYEFHGTQKNTGIRPGQTFNIDYSITQMLPLTRDKGTLLQIGLVGYGQYQTTDHRGVTAIAAATHYRVNALGITADVMVPDRQIDVGVKYLKEFANTSTVQGHSLQITAGVTF
ncbi:MAG TPA: transporter [Vicinamibacterales bacterium]|nr:transporter [Vicinamibacterales bacterium]